MLTIQSAMYLLLNYSPTVDAMIRYQPNHWVQRYGGQIHNRHRDEDTIDDHRVNWRIPLHLGGEEGRLVELDR